MTTTEAQTARFAAYDEHGNLLMLDLPFREGDIITYTPEQHHGQEAIARVYCRGVHFALDTFWGLDGTCPDAHRLTAAELSSATVSFNLADFERINARDHRAHPVTDYAAADRRQVTEQHGHRVIEFLRPGAQPDPATRLTNARKIVADAESNLRSAKLRLDLAQRDLADLEIELEDHRG